VTGAEENCAGTLPEKIIIRIIRDTDRFMIRNFGFWDN
jgi:hypothetical protein